MTLFISIIFILSSYVLIFNLPSSDGLDSNGGYHVSKISDILTPSERLAYATFGTWPSRIYYSDKKHCFVVREQAGQYKNDLRTKKGKRFKAIPRWQYYLSQLSPMNLIKSGMELSSIGSALVGLGGGSGNNDDGDDIDIDTDGGADGGADSGAEDGANGGADGNENNDKDTEKEPGLLSKGINMGKNIMSPLFNLFGSSKDENNNNNNEKKDDDNGKKDEKEDEKEDDKKDDNKDKEEDDKPADSVDYMGLAQDAMQSDIAKDAVKAAISVFVPGGSAIVAAMDAASKYNKVDDTVDKVEDKIPKF